MPVEDETHVPVDRFGQWREAFGRLRAAEMTSDHASTFTATMRHVPMGPAIALGASFPSLHVRRTDKMIRARDEEVYHLTMLTAGQGMGSGSSSGPAQRIFPRQVHLVVSSEPYETRFVSTPDSGSVEGIGFDLPISMLPVPAHRVRRLVGRALPTELGMGAVLSAFLLALDRQMPALSALDAARLGTTAVDLLAGFITRELEDEDVLPPETRLRTMLHEVRTFVRQHLHDPELTPSTIAAAHNVSLSYLHRSFTGESQGTTLAAFIRRQRLQKAYQDLMDPTLRALPIHAIAIRCGIVQAPTFARAFRSAYGISPSEHRHESGRQRP
ncbi:AraC family transcriptional regulator [Streptomyces sp. NPDC048332]|uniref:helix-turn-helix transcriptional regulator n=1 Tax=Streptomyces sp. NPDC048332 TaxID=3154619 RepID=UPI0034426120